MTLAVVSPARRAVVYVRVSTKEQLQRDGDPDGYSIPAQREACERKAASLGAEVTSVYIDRGESARSSDRPELQRMLAELAVLPKRRRGLRLPHPRASWPPMRGRR